MERDILYLAVPDALSATRRLVMEHAGYSVTMARSADQALVVLRDKTFDFAVIGSRVPAAEAQRLMSAVRSLTSRPTLFSLDNRGHHSVDYTLRAMAGPEELLAVLGEALIRRHGHEAPHEGCYMFVDENRKYIHVTDGAAELLGYERGALIGRTIDDVAAPEMDVNGRFEAYVEEGFQKGTFRLRRQDGSLVDIEYSAQVLPDGCMVSELKAPRRPAGHVARQAKQLKIRPL